MIESIPDEIITAFLAYSWPGNTRELENAMERLVLLSDGPVLDSANMPAEIVTDGLPEPAEDFKGRVGDAASAAEKHLIREALEKAAGNRTRAAEILGISRRTLYKKIKEYDL